MSLQQYLEETNEPCKAELAMSVDAVSDTYWQTARGTIRERCEAVFNQELLSDVKFVVRDSRGGSKTIPAHKFMLAISSPVFFAMFYLSRYSVKLEITKALILCLNRRLL